MNNNSYPMLEEGKIENERSSSMTLIHFKSCSCVITYSSDTRLKYSFCDTYQFGEGMNPTRSNRQ